MTDQVQIFRFFDPFQTASSSRNTVLATTAGTDRVVLAGIGETLEIANEGTDTVFVNLGPLASNSTITATAGGSVTAAATGDYAVQAGSIKQIYCAGWVTCAAVRSASGSQIVRLTRGNGM